MKRLIYILLGLILPLAAIAQTGAVSANDILRQFLSKVDGNTLTSSFVLTVSEDAMTPISYSGKVQMRGPKFRLSMLGNEGAYDGKTYYLFSEETNELTLTTPTPEELLEANPILFARELQRLSAVRFGAGGKSTKYHIIELVPNNQDAGVQRFVIKIRKDSLLPEEVIVKEENKTTTLRFTDAAYEAEIPSFVITKPNAFINDLR